MGQRNRKRSKTGLARRLKTGNKKTLHNKRISHTRVAAEYKDINERVTKYAEELKEKKGVVEVEEEMTFDQLKKLLTKDEPKRDRLRLSLDDKLYLEPLLERHQENYEKMAKDVKLNRLQWNAHQIMKKHEQYKKYLAEEN